jgi:hypothetical protein
LIHSLQQTFRSTYVVLLTRRFSARVEILGEIDAENVTVFECYLVLRVSQSWEEGASKSIELREKQVRMSRGGVAEDTRPDASDSISSPTLAAHTWELAKLKEVQIGAMQCVYMQGNSGQNTYMWLESWLT